MPSASRSIFRVGICFEVRRLSLRMDPLMPGRREAVGVFAWMIKRRRRGRGRVMVRVRVRVRVMVRVRVFLPG